MEISVTVAQRNSGEFEFTVRTRIPDLDSSSVRTYRRPSLRDLLDEVLAEHDFETRYLARHVIHEAEDIEVARSERFRIIRSEEVEPF